MKVSWLRLAASLLVAFWVIVGGLAIYIGQQPGEPQIVAFYLMHIFGFPSGFLVTGAFWLLGMTELINFYQLNWPLRIFAVFAQCFTVHWGISLLKDRTPK